MRGNSKRYRQLRTELQRLRRHFLPEKWDLTGTYSDRQLDRTRAYRILVHAEIEYFIEKAIIDVVERRYREWEKAGKPSYVILCLLAAHQVGWQDIETTEHGLPPLDRIKIKRQDESIHRMIGRVVEQFRDIVKNNNGIMERNLKRLLMPMGIALSDMDTTWLNNMNSFGSQRGFVAHTSRIGIVTVPDPKTEFSNVRELLEGLEGLDKMIANL